MPWKRYMGLALVVSSGSDKMKAEEIYNRVVDKYGKKQWFRMAAIADDEVIVYVNNIKKCPSEAELSNEFDFSVKVKLMKNGPKPA